MQTLGVAWNECRHWVWRGMNVDIGCGVERSHWGVACNADIGCGVECRHWGVAWNADIGV